MNLKDARAPLAVAAIVLVVVITATSLLCFGTPESDRSGGVFDGFCEASSIVPWQGGYLVADNEAIDRLYEFTGDLTPRPPRKLSVPVEDIEALASVPEGLLIVGSQGANKRGERRPLRERVLIDGHRAVTPDLSGCPPCIAVRSRPPKRGGLSVEGAAHWQGALWLGLRSPLVDGKALLLRMNGDPRVALDVAEMSMLDLEGFGVRELIPWRGALLILAGPSDATESRHRVYSLETPGATPIRLRLELPTRTEGLAPMTDGRFVFVQDGDGRPGQQCRVPSTWAHVSLPIPPSRP